MRATVCGARERGPAIVTTFRCDALLFDLDGVLVDSTERVERAWRAWCERHALEADDVIRVAHGRRTAETIACVAPHLHAEREATAVERFDHGGDDGLVALPGSAELLRALPGGRWAVVTSGPHDLARASMAACGLPRAPVLVGGDDIELGKPDPEGYLAAAARLGVRAERCVVLEDTPSGIAAGKAAGAAVVALATTYPRAELAAADACVDDLRSMSVAARAGGVELRVATAPP